MAFDRHKQALRGTPRARLVRRIGAAVVVTTAAVAGGVTVSLPTEAPVAASAISAPTRQVEAVPVPVRVAPISRSEARVQLEPKPPEVTGHLFAVDAVNIRQRPTEDSRQVGTLEWAEKIAISGETRGPWVEVVIGKKGFWVHGAFLAEEKPKPEPEPEPEPVEEEATTSSAPTGVSGASCPAGSSVESGLTSNAVAVYRAVCAAFPSVTSYGGLRPGDSGEHGTGRALDIMVSGSLGWEIAEYVRANAGSLGVSEVIYSQKIWTVERSGEGWRSMEDRGSTTANHYDHVHVTTY